MSSISPDPRLDRAGLESLGGQAALDELRGRDQALSQDSSVAELAYADATSQAPVGSQSDTGEDVLNAAAWDDVPEGDRMLTGNTELEGQLGALDLSQAADAGADAVLTSLG